jgi:hypothetical protein
MSCYFHVLCRSLATEGSSQHCGGLQYREKPNRRIEPAGQKRCTELVSCWIVNLGIGPRLLILLAVASEER